LKRHLPRESFKALNMTKNLSNTLLKLNDTVLDKPVYYKLRTNVFEIITLIWIDDFQDNYLDSLEVICTNIKESCFSSKGINRVSLK